MFASTPQAPTLLQAMLQIVSGCLQIETRKERRLEAQKGRKGWFS